MKVYAVLQTYDYEGSRLIGIFTGLDNAKDYVRRFDESAAKLRGHEHPPFRPKREISWRAVECAEEEDDWASVWWVAEGDFCNDGYEIEEREVR